LGNMERIFEGGLGLSYGGIKEKKNQNRGRRREARQRMVNNPEKGRVIPYGRVIREVENGHQRTEGTRV